MRFPLPSGITPPGHQKSPSPFFGTIYTISNFGPATLHLLMCLWRQNMLVLRERMLSAPRKTIFWSKFSRKCPKPVLFDCFYLSKFCLSAKSFRGKMVSLYCFERAHYTNPRSTLDENWVSVIQLVFKMPPRFQESDKSFSNMIFSAIFFKFQNNNSVTFFSSKFCLYLGVSTRCRNLLQKKNCFWCSKLKRIKLKQSFKLDFINNHVESSFCFINFWEKACWNADLVVIGMKLVPVRLN